MTEKINLKIVQLLESLIPLVDAVECNDGDTLNALTSNETVIFLAEGSWSKPCALTLGDIRKISHLALAIKNDK